MEWCIYIIGHDDASSNKIRRSTIERAVLESPAENESTPFLFQFVSTRRGCFFSRYTLFACELKIKEFSNAEERTREDRIGVNLQLRFVAQIEPHEDNYCLFFYVNEITRNLTQRPLLETDCIRNCVLCFCNPQFTADAVSCNFHSFVLPIPLAPFSLAKHSICASLLSS